MRRYAELAIAPMKHRSVTRHLRDACRLDAVFKLHVGLLSHSGG